MNSKVSSVKHTTVVGILLRSNFEPERETEERSESSVILLRGLKTVVFVGRCFGALSRTDILEQTNKFKRKNRKINAASILCGLITLFCVINAILLTRHNYIKFQKDKTTLVKLEGFNHACYAAAMSLIYLYQLFASEKVRDIVTSFLVANRLSQLSSFTERKGIGKYPTFCWVMIVICVTLGVLENAMFDWQSVRRGIAKGKDWNLLELYYKEIFKHWHVVLPNYSPVVVVILIIFIKVATWGWVYMDVVCVLLCRALWEKLWVISENLKWNPFGVEETQNLPQRKVTLEVRSALGILNSDSEQNHKPADISKQEYVMVTQLVEQVQKYISPLIMVCYVGNMYLLITMLFNWIGPFSSEMVSREKNIHVCVAFFEFLLRVAIITYFAGEVHQMCLEIRRRIQMCPNSVYSSSMEHLERILIANPAGICLFDTFMITRKFFVSIVSFIFTTEIVLLQSFSGYYNHTISNNGTSIVPQLTEN